jgi:hypothetical protein
MKKKFIKIKFYCLPLPAHCHYCTNFSLEITASPPALVESLGTLPAQFNTLLKEEQAIEDWTRKSELTDRIQAADRRQDLALTAIKTQVRALQYITIQGTADAAKRVYTMLTDYGNVNAKPYEAQAGDIESIIREISSGGRYYADIVSLQQPAPALAAMISELQQAFTLFKQLLGQRDTQSLLKPERTFSKVRPDIEAVYRQITDIIDANALIGTSTAYATFIDHMNPEIERLNEEFHRVRHDIKLSEPEQIQPQVYTGLPVTPTPKVLYVTPQGTVRLELGKDYNLSFDKNVEVGVANCNIHGIGAYKGSKTVTFVIARI